MTPRNAPLIVAAAFAVLLGQGCVGTALYHPESAIRHTPEHASLAFEDVSFSSRDGVRLTGWWIPAANPRGTVLFCHGNGGNISACLDTAIIVNGLGLNLLLFDYRGYGRSGGSPSEQGTYDDAEAAWEYLVNGRKVRPEKLIVWGRSLGGPIAAKTASEHHPGLAVMESTFVSLEQLVDDRFSWVPSWALSGHVYDTRRHLEKVGVPVLVIHSPDDEMIPFAHGRAIYDSIRGPKTFLEIRGDHNRGFVNSRKAYEAGIGDFLSKHLDAVGVSAQ